MLNDFLATRKLIVPNSVEVIDYNMFKGNSIFKNYPEFLQMVKKLGIYKVPATSRLPKAITKSKRISRVAKQLVANFKPKTASVDIAAQLDKTPFKEKT